MRISDWSSDVCSSDLIDPTAEVQGRQGSNDAKEGDQQADGDKDVRKPVEPAVTVSEIYEEVLGAGRILENIRRRIDDCFAKLLPGPPQWERLGVTNIHHLLIDFIESTGEGQPGRRSEEHTSELQSLMSSSDAVFC